MKKFLKISSLILVLSLLVNSLPMNVFAAKYRSWLLAEDDLPVVDSGLVPEEAVVPEEVTVLEEVEESRTEYSKEFKLSNGLYAAAVYAAPVHYMEDGQWKDIDNTLKTSRIGSLNYYTNTAGVWDVQLPSQLDANAPVTITKDGYTLSFYMAGQLTQPIIGPGTLDPNIPTQQLTVDIAEAAAAVPQVLDPTEAKEAAEFEETVLSKVSSRLAYNNVYQNTNITYDLLSNQLKESVILTQYDSTLRGYRFRLSVGELVPVQQEDGQIDFYDSQQEEIILTMPAPYLFDAEMQYSFDVQVSLTGGDGEYELTYLLPQEWLADESRQWPVVLDPVVHASTITTNIRDKVVTEKRAISYLHPTNDCGHGNDGINRSFLKYEKLPALTSADVIVKALITMYKPVGAASDVVVEAHKVNSTWDYMQLSWSNAPSFNPTVEDYVIARGAGYHVWEITDIVRGWYEGENTGILFKASDTFEKVSYNTIRSFCSSDYSNSLYYPSLLIQFRNNNGLEDYWDYTATSAGRAGTGYVNNYTGNLVWTRSDLGFGGNRMPVAITHVYNANDCQNNSFSMGYGWRTNFNQRVYQWTTDTSYYIWEDGDGTKHYFKYASSGTYKDEDGLELTLTTTGSGDSKYCITAKDGSKSYFDASGRLKKLTNNQATKSSITITYTASTGLKISSITDGVGRKYTFVYASNGTLSRIKYTGTGTTELAYVTFGYSNGNLTTITDKDGKASTYTYTGHFLTSAKDVDGYKVSYTYNQIDTSANRYKPSRVVKIADSDDGVSGGELTIEYASNQTTFRDVNGNLQIMQFNNWGNTVCIQDGQGHATYARYAQDQSSSAKSNQLRLSSKLQNTVGNALKDSSFENGTLWTAVNSSVTRAISSSSAFHGSKSLSMTRASAGTASGVSGGQITVPANQTVTFSAYVKTGAGAAYLALKSGSTTVTSEVLNPNTNWTRLEVSFTPTSTTAVTPQLLTKAAGTTYIDCVQLEFAPTASRYNLIENGDFRYGGSPAYNWTIHCNTSTANDKIITAGSAAAPELDKNVLRVQGEPLYRKYLQQTVKVSGKAGDTFVLGGWAKGDAAPFSSYAVFPREFGLQAIFNYTDGTKSSAQRVNFNPNTDKSVNWQYAATAVVAEKAYSSVTIQILYGYNVNTMYFDGIQLYKEEFGNSYTYDQNGNVISVKDLQGQTTKYEYTNNNLTKAILPTGAKLTYTYDNYHNVKTATSDTGIVYTFAYDTYGNNTSVSIGSGTQKITATATYTSDGNRLASTTDAAGKTTTYSYNANTNALEWVQYPEDTTATRMKYTYDSMYRMASAAAQTDTGLSPSVKYTYQNDMLTGVTTDTTAYSLTYGNFALRSGIRIGSRSLASYSYTARNHYLERLDYGNDDYVKYTYDKLGRVTKQTFEDGDTVAFTYDNSGALAKVKDSATGRTTTYYYDFTDRLMKTVETGSNYSHSVGYSYDKINNLTSLVETINGVKHTTSYTYDDDNRVTGVTRDGTGRTYSYDSFGRVNQRITKKGSTALLTDTFTFRTQSSTKATTQVATLKSSAAGYQVTYTYGYDNNGNITSISDGTHTTTYVYDTANQLIRENDQKAGTTRTWEYDSSGNILNRKEYAYTTGSLGTPTKTVTYAYGDSEWGDLLTAYDSRTITYDTVGNPLSDGVRQYTWEHGRELATITKDGATWTNTYNQDGMRIRRTNGTVTYGYVYNGSQLSQMTVGSNTLNFSYDANGIPMSVSYNGTTYYYATNLQGDVTAILNASGSPVVSYTYDAWGKPLTVTGSLATTLGTHNPLRYRGYVYDTETELYYLQSRYYNPDTGRFLNADAFTSTGQGFTGNNMFAYCGNNPVARKDDGGAFWDTIFDVVSLVSSVAEVIINPTSGAAWAGLAADVVCTVVPGLTGGGAIVKAVTKADDVVDTAKAVYKAADKASDIRKATGSYEILYKSGKNYVGKGGFKRAITSASKTRQTNGIIDEVVSITWKKAPNSKAAFIDEYLAQLQRGVLSSNKNAWTYNKIWSPGRNYYHQSLR